MGVQNARFFTGQLTQEIDGQTFYADAAVTEDGSVLIRADSEEYSAFELAKHEGYHLLVKRLPEMAAKIQKRLLGEGKITKEMIESYVDAYAGIYGDDTDAYVEEIVADTYAGMNRTGYGTNKLRADVKMEVGQWQKKPAARERRRRRCPLRRIRPQKLSGRQPCGRRKRLYLRFPDIASGYGRDHAAGGRRGTRSRQPGRYSKGRAGGYENARAVGTERDGKAFVRNRYTGKRLMVTTNSIRHGINGAANRVLTNARLGAVVGDIVQNAVPINALYNTAKDVTGTYAMAGYATDSAGREFAAIITVEQKTGKIAAVEAYDMLHAVSGRQKKVARRTRSPRAYTLSRLPKSVYPICSELSTVRTRVFYRKMCCKIRRAEKPAGGLYREGQILVSGRAVSGSDGGEGGTVCAAAGVQTGERAGGESERAGAGEAGGFAADGRGGAAVVLHGRAA